MLTSFNIRLSCPMSLLALLTTTFLLVIRSRHQSVYSIASSMVTSVTGLSPTTDTMFSTARIRLLRQTRNWFGDSSLISSFVSVSYSSNSFDNIGAGRFSAPKSAAVAATSLATPFATSASRRTSRASVGCCTSCSTSTYSNPRDRALCRASS